MTNSEDLESVAHVDMDSCFFTRLIAPRIPDCEGLQRVRPHERIGIGNRVAKRSPDCLIIDLWGGVQQFQRL